MGWQCFWINLQASVKVKHFVAIEAAFIELKLAHSKRLAAATLKPTAYSAIPRPAD
jgi:hypothetical protein